MHDELIDDNTDPPTIRLIHEVSPNGDFVTILRDGDTWESVHYKMRKALDDRREQTREFFTLIVQSIMIHDVDEHEDLICNIEHGPLRKLKHLSGHLHYE